MPRMQFTKTGAAVWISHLDLMRALQRAFRRAGLLLKHSQGYSPHPILSIAMPLSVGVSSDCEIADFELENPDVELSSLAERLTRALPEGITVLRCYDNGQALKHLKWLRAVLTLDYDHGVPDGAAAAIEALFRTPSVTVVKHGKNGDSEVDLIPMLQSFSVTQPSETTLLLTATVSAQNPTLNPLLLSAAIERHLPDCKPDFVRCRRSAFLDSSMFLFT